jgi:hypothetical protein
MCSAPSAGGDIPLMIAVLAGAHTGAFDQQRRYRNPRPASPSNTGVFANASPKHPMCGPISSHVIHSMFGRFPCAATAPAAKNPRLVIPVRLLCEYAKIKLLASI